MEFIPLPKIFRPAVGADMVFIVHASGNNMHPTVSNKDYLICIKTTELKQGDIAILQKGVKKFHCKFYRELKGKPFYEDVNQEIFDHKGWKLIGKVSGIYKQLCII